MVWSSTSTTRATGFSGMANLSATSVIVPGKMAKGTGKLSRRFFARSRAYLGKNMRRWPLDEPPAPLCRRPRRQERPYAHRSHGPDSRHALLLHHRHEFAV